jgi:hypothetical protein
MQDVRQNEMYASRWMPVLIRHACSPSSVRMGAKDTLMGLLRDNDQLLECSITQETMAQFEEQLLLRKDEKTLELLHTLCHSENRPISLNQGECFRDGF